MIKIAEHSNKSFIGVGPPLPEKIPDISLLFESYLRPSNTFLKDKHLSTDELKSAYFSLAKSKSTGYDEINFNVEK